MAISVNQPIGANDLIESLYPIGSIFLTINNADYTNFLGKTWERIEADKALWTASSDAGNTISAGLPNITGSVRLQWNDNSAAGVIFNSAGSGCLSTYSDGYSHYVKASTSTTGHKNALSFNANNGASVSGIYGNSTTVQPPAYKVYAWKRTS